MCKVVYFIQSMCYTASVALMTVISAERYAAIIHPLKSKQITTLCLLRSVVILIWLSSALLAIPVFIMYDFLDLQTIHYCIPTTKINKSAFVSVTFLLGYILPLLLMACLYIRISLLLWRTSKGKGLTGYSSNRVVFRKTPEETTVMLPSQPTGQIATTPKMKTKCFSSGIPNKLFDESTGADTLYNTEKDALNSSKTRMSSATELCELTTEADDYTNDWPTMSQSEATTPELNNGKVQSFVDATPVHTPKPRKPNGGQKKQGVRSENAALVARRRIIRLLVFVVASFALCVLPYHAMNLWNLSQNAAVTKHKELLQVLAFFFYYLNNAVNPFLYAFLSENFRRSLSELFTFTKRNPRKQSCTGLSKTLLETKCTT